MAGFMRLFCWLVIAIFSRTTNAMNAGEETQLAMEIVICNAQLDIQDFLNLSITNHQYQNLFDKKLWEFLIRKIKNREWKISSNLTNKQSYLIARRVLLISFNYKKDRESKMLSKSNKLVHLEENGITNSVDGFKNFFQTLIDKMPQVICSVGGTDCYSENVAPVFDQALREDILLIFLQVSNTKQKWPHYPNILYAAKCQSRILGWTLQGYVVDIGIECTDDGQADLELAKFCAHIRCMQPRLKACELCKLLLQTTDKNEESLKKIPHGGILNRDAAIKAVEEYEFP